jgi:outer membrane immunogenic protein
MHPLSAALIAAVSAIALTQTTLAADLPVKAPAQIAAPVYSWTGLYVGGHLGGAWTGKDDSVANMLPGFAVVFPRNLPFNTGGSSVIGGGQVGYNWQFGRNWVAGLEGDFSGTQIDGSTTYSPVPPGPNGFFIAPSLMTMGRDVKWTASLRGRLGLAWDRFLVYGTGGVAWTHADYLGMDSRAGGGATDVASFSATKTGWVAGGGAEYGLAPNWTVRGEYLYYSTDGVSAVATPSVGPPSINFTWDHTNVHVVRFALNYKFGD